MTAAAVTDHYARMHLGNRAKRRRVAHASAAGMRLEIERELRAELAADDSPDRQGWIAIPGLAATLTDSVKRGGVARGVPLIAEQAGCDARTVSRLIAKLTDGDPSGAMVWRIRGTKGHGVSRWFPSARLVDHLCAWLDRITGRMAQRKAKGRNTPRVQHDTKSDGAAPLQGGLANGTSPPPEQTTTEPDIVDLSGTCQHGRPLRRCVACSTALVRAATA